MYKLKTIQETWKLYLELKKDLQEFIDITTHRNFWLVHYSKEFKKKKKRFFLKNYIKESHNFICYLDS